MYTKGWKYWALGGIWLEPSRKIRMEMIVVMKHYAIICFTVMEPKKVLIFAFSHCGSRTANFHLQIFYCGICIILFVPNLAQLPASRNLLKPRSDCMRVLTLYAWCPLLQKWEPSRHSWCILGKWLDRGPKFEKSSLSPPDVLNGR